MPAPQTAVVAERVAGTAVAGTVVAVVVGTVVAVVAVAVVAVVAVAGGARLRVVYVRRRVRMQTAQVRSTVRSLQQRPRRGKAYRWQR